jgi:ferric-dicitrate binding protein FerR (iron transport regulator)
LVEGSVGFFKEGKTFDASADPVLEPGHIASWKKQRNSLKIEKADPTLYTGWINGKIIFDHMKFKDIRKKLERRYNVSISNSYEESKEIRFTASFDTETIDQVLRAFNKNYPMRYKINGNKIHIEKP